jgi:hypothetical protein
MKRETKRQKFIGKVSTYGDGRKHIEVPKNKRKDFESGDAVFVEKIDG